MKQAASRALLTAFFMLVFCLAYSSVLEMEALCFPEILVGFHQSTQNYASKEFISPF
jgi:hypothetical protein